MTLKSHPSDAGQMGLVLGEIIQAWDSNRPYSADHVLTHYISHPDKTSCAVVASNEGRVLGFQSLKLARPGNPYDVEAWLGDYRHVCQVGAVTPRRWPLAFQKNTNGCTKRRTRIDRCNNRVKQCGCAKVLWLYGIQNLSNLARQDP